MQRILIFLAILSYQLGQAQNQPDEALGHIWGRLYQFVIQQHPGFTGNKSSELAILLLEVDSTGKISHVYVKGENTDTIYNIFQRMPLSVFNGWQSLTTRNKIIMIPYFYLFQESSSDVHRLLTNYYDKPIRTAYIAESGNIIYLRYIFGLAPEGPYDCPVGRFEIISDSAEKSKPAITNREKENQLLSNSKLRDSSKGYFTYNPNRCFDCLPLTITDTLRRIPAPDSRDQ